MAEVVYVLFKYYKYNKETIWYMLQAFLESTFLIVEEEKVVLHALTLFSLSWLDFADCYLLAKKQTGKYDEILTFDKKIQNIVK